MTSKASKLCSVALALACVPALALGAPKKAPKADAKPPAAEKAADVAPPAEEKKDAPAEAPPPPSTPEMFEQAMGLHYGGNPRDSAPALYAYLRGAARTADPYEYAELFLAQDLYALGFTHAAVVHAAQVVKDRARPELLPEALKTLERVSAGPHDEALVQREVLYASDFGLVPPEAADFVAFYKGLSAFEDGALKWANASFDRLDPKSPYAARAKLLRAAHKLQKDNDLEGALADFEALAADEKASVEVRNEAKISAARLWFEKKDFAKAEALYDAVELPELDPGRAQILLEKAWTHYERRSYSTAMGLLLALEAPSFRDAFLPEKFRLRAFIYKDLCHFLPAKRAAKDVLRRYRSSLTAIHEREELKSDPRLLRAALETDRTARAAAQLVQTLERERDAIDAWAGRFSASGLTKHLHALYDAALNEAVRRREAVLHDALVSVADTLLREEEQARLLDYEIGLDLYKRVKKGGRAFQTLADEEFLGPREVAFDFDGEYWNDELKDYRFKLESRCSAVEADK